MRARWLRVLSSYEVRLVEKTSLGEYCAPGTGKIVWYWGECDLEAKVISIRKDLTFIDRIWTLIHELTHANFPDAEEDFVLERGDRLFQKLSRRSMNILADALRSARK